MGNCMNELCANDKKVPAKSQNAGQSSGAQAHSGGVFVPKKPYSWEKKRADKNPLDYICEQKEKETIIKNPNDLKGEQYQIGHCSDCNFYIKDYTAAITIDECQNCEFFLGPCQSSVFIRDCKNCKIVMAARQLRMRSCHNIQLLVLAATEPVIESSSKLQFGCFDFFYDELKAQFDLVDLSIWNNEWSEIFDFTPNVKAVHYEYLDEAIRAKHLIQNIELAMDNDVSLENEKDSNMDEENENEKIIVPFTSGKRGKNSKNKWIIVFFEPALTYVELIYEKLYFSIFKKNLQKIWISFTKEIVPTASQARNLFASVKDNKQNLTNAASNKKIIVWEVCDSRTAKEIANENEIPIEIEKEENKEKQNKYLVNSQKKTFEISIKSVIEVIDGIIKHGTLSYYCSPSQDISTFMGREVFEAWKEKASKIK